MKTLTKSAKTRNLKTDPISEAELDALLERAATDPLFELKASNSLIVMIEKMEVQ